MAPLHLKFQKYRTRLIQAARLAQPVEHETLKVIVMGTGPMLGNHVKLCVLVYIVELVILTLIAGAQNRPRGDSNP